MTFSSIWAVVRLAMAAATVVALRVQFGKIDDEPGLTIGGFFSLFTNESNILAVVMLVVGAVFTLAALTPPAWWDALRGATLTWLALTGIVYVALISEPERRFVYDISEASDHLHKVMPLFLLLDWLLFPPRRRLEMRTALWWTVPPIAFCIYSLVRGAFVDWYPYDFLDPNEQGGYLGVVLYAVGIALGFVVFSALVVWLGNQAGRRGADAAVTQSI